MIKNFKLYISDRSGVPKYHNKNITHLISIGDPGQKKPYIGHFAIKPKILRMEFDDVLAEDSSHLSPTEKDIEKIICFADQIKILIYQFKQVNLLIHCYAGQSRSTAAAFIFLNIINPNKEEDNFKYLLECRDCAVPNTLMVDFADKLLTKNGKMSSITRLHRNNFLINNAWVPKNEQT